MVGHETGLKERDENISALTMENGRLKDICEPNLTQIYS